MDLFQFSLNRFYLKSPITWMHNIKQDMKIFFIFSILLFSPYLDLYYIITLIILQTYILITLKIPKQIIKIFILFLMPILLLIIISSRINTVYATNYSYCLNQLKILSLINNFNISLIHKKYRFFYITYLIKVSYYFIAIPVFIMRISTISILYLISIRILFLTTNYEKIILFFLAPLNKISNKNMQNIMIISAFSIQFLEVIIYKLHQLIIVHKIRGIIYISYRNQHQPYLIFLYLWTTFYQYLHKQITKISSALYIRNIKILKF